MSRKRVSVCSGTPPGDVAEMGGEDVGHAGEAMDGPGENAGGDGEVRMDDVGLPFADVTERGEETCGDVEAHLVDGAGVRCAASAGGAEYFDAVLLLVGGVPAEGGGLDAHFVAAQYHLGGDALRYAPAASAERRIFVAEDENAH